ncbi:MAG: hypothetical protein GX196_03100 [Clostridiaceae bacterium]|nr:hypothetical protein [Clostridiaceae bacterium]
MKYFSDLINTKVIHIADNKTLGRLTDILLFKDTNKICAIIASKENFVYKNRLILKDDILAITKDSIYVKSPGIKYTKVIPIKDDVISYVNGIEKKKVLTKKGEVLGLVRNSAFDFEAGELVEFEIGTTFTDDLLNGRKRLVLKDTNHPGSPLIVDEAEILDKEKGLIKMLKKSKIT